MSADAIPFTALVPETAATPIDIYDQHAALKMAIVERSGAHLLGDEWDNPGMYILLDRHDSDGAWGAYVGKAPAGIRSRLADHLRRKDHWHRALLIRKDTTQGFNSAQVGWLEGRLYELLAVAEDARLHNGNRPSDETLPPYDRQMLELVVLPVARVLRLLGHDPASPDAESPVPKSRRRMTNYDVSVLQLIEAGLLDSNARLTSANGAWPAEAAVLPSGTIEMGGTEYATPSAAACAVKGGAANGWDFWALTTSSGLVRLSSLRKRFLDAQQGG